MPVAGLHFDLRFFLAHIDEQARARAILPRASVSGSVCRPQGKAAPGTQEKTILIARFSEFNLSPALMARLDANKFVTPTPVQAGAIPPALQGRDVLATAQTGTGKTLSFLIPIVQLLQMAEARGPAAHALILLPTRELAMQVEQAFRDIRSNSSQTVALVVGGLHERAQLDAIRHGAKLIVATPGRLEDFLKRKLLSLGQVKILVLDEVDRMLDMGFQPAIARIVATLPAVRQTLCYSATLEGDVKEVVRKYLNQPVRIEIGSVLKPAENVELRTFEVEPDKKHELLEHLLGAEKGSFLVFVRTKHGAERVARRLTRSGWSATQIHGDRSQSQRNAALRSFSEGHHRILVATDVAARGIDVANIAHVVNFDMPKVAEDFVHRIGRTGRMSAKGIASTFAGPAERNELRKIEKTLSIQMKRFRVRSLTRNAA
jgi:ATP-dependent RNA helicase RhlE